MVASFENLELLPVLARASDFSRSSIAPAYYDSLTYTINVDIIRHARWISSVLSSAQFKWEAILKKIQHGDSWLEPFLDGISQYVRSVVTNGWPGIARSANVGFGLTQEFRFSRTRNCKERVDSHK